METGWLTEGFSFYEANKPLIVMAVGAIAVSGVYSLWQLQTSWEWLDFIPKRRGRMLRKDRRKYVERMSLDAFVDWVETQVYNENISRAEAKEVYAKLKRVFNTSRDLYPSPRLLKENIRKRRQSGVHAPVNLPDKTVVKRKHMFEKVA